MTLAHHLQQGRVAEALALAHLQAAGLYLLAQNYRPSVRGGGEIDLIMGDARRACARDPTLVFVEVRTRNTERYGGALVSIDHAKRRKLLQAARHYLHALPSLPPCRFDIVSVSQPQNGPKPLLVWLEAAFTLDDISIRDNWR